MNFKSHYFSSQSAMVFSVKLHGRFNILWHSYSILEYVPNIWLHFLQDSLFLLEFAQYPWCKSGLFGPTSIDSKDHQLHRLWFFEILERHLFKWTIFLLNEQFSTSSGVLLMFNAISRHKSPLSLWNRLFFDAVIHSLVQHHLLLTFLVYLGNEVLDYDVVSQLLNIAVGILNLVFMWIKTWIFLLAVTMGIFSLSFTLFIAWARIITQLSTCGNTNSIPIYWTLPISIILIYTKICTWECSVITHSSKWIKGGRVLIIIFNHFAWFVIP